MGFMEKKDQSGRKMPRTELLVRTNIHKVDDTQPHKAGELLIGHTVTHDISATGISLLSNEIIDLQGEEYFVLEFSLSRSKTFYIPVKFVRTGDFTRSAQYKYFYGFAFEFGEDSDIMRDLTMALFQYRIEGR